MPLTDTACKSAKPTDKPFRLSDGGGLQLWVHTSGSRTWRLAYRFDGKQRFATFGTYPAISLAEARGQREDAKKLLRQGIDPRAANVGDKPIQKFRTLTYAWFENAKLAWKPIYRARAWSRIERDMLPLLGDKDITKIEPTDVLEAVRVVEARGALYTARRVRQAISAVFKYAKASGIVKLNPAADLDAAMKPRSKVVHLASIPERELPGVFREAGTL